MSKARTACLSPKLPPPNIHSNSASGNTAFRAPPSPTVNPPHKKMEYPGSKVTQEATECADGRGGGMNVSGWGWGSPQVMELRVTSIPHCAL